MASLPLRVAVYAISVITPLQAADQLRFETASVKPASQCTFQNSFDPGMIALNGDPLSVLLTEAFQVKKDQIIGPSWLDSDCILVNAKMPEGVTRDQLPEMLHALLVERFKLAAHKETRQRSGYALVVDKSGPKLQESDPNSFSARMHAGQVKFGFGGHPMLKGAMTMTALAKHLSKTLDAPVQDFTELKGTYDIDLSWITDRLGPSAQNYAVTHPDATDTPAAVPSGDDIFTSIRDTLGLRLASRKLQVEVVVIDHIERAPTEN